MAIPSLRRLLHSPHRPVVVVTQPDRPSGRGRRTVPSPVKELALSAGIEVLQPERINDPAVVTKLLAYEADLCVTLSFGQFIGPVLLNGIRWGGINVHPSLLPKYRGAAPVNWAVLRGELKTGVTVFKLTRRMDAGPILVVRETLIKPDETAGELQDRLAAIAPDALMAALEMYGPTEAPAGHPQDDAQATLAPKLTKEMGWLDLNRPAHEVAAWVNGLYPWPGVQLAYVSQRDGRRIEVRLARATRVVDRRDSCGAAPGTILEDGAVACADGAIRILEIQPAGGRVMSWQDFVNGRRVQPRDRFEPLASKPAP